MMAYPVDPQGHGKLARPNLPQVRGVRRVMGQICLWEGAGQASGPCRLLRDDLSCGAAKLGEAIENQCGVAGEE